MAAVIHAPEIGYPDLAWFNTDRALSLADLRGKLVILDFWTFCCINCMHILPTLRTIEERYRREVVVIGVHSPKFAAERAPDNVAHAIARYDIRHPVVHDPEFRIWRQYAIRSWPTLAFIAPDGQFLGQAPGEPDPERLSALVDDLLSKAREGGILRPSALALAPPAPRAGRFSFPGKLKPYRGEIHPHARWVLADSGHHQVALLGEEGDEVLRLGAGSPGFADGDLTHGRFDGPQGLVAAGDLIYVADTGNHAIRRIDLAAERIETLAGTGKRGRPLDTEPSPGKATALASVWDLDIGDGRLFFANAGTHQLGLLDLAMGKVTRLAGDGGEDIIDGEAAYARLAQPSGLAFDEGTRTLYFADSETSSVRALDLKHNPRVETLVGAGLFEFGHENGPFGTARLQHPLGLALWNDELLVADSYNGAIRRLDLAARTVADFDGGTYECTDPICIPANEPAGVAWNGDNRVFLVDTNNHRILAYEPESRRYRTWAS